jgi:hypothetical protein
MQLKIGKEIYLKESSHRQAISELKIKEKQNKFKNLAPIGQSL